jgi:hypothetical protein
MLNTHAAGDAASLLSRDVTVRAASMGAAYNTGCSRRSGGSQATPTWLIARVQRRSHRLARLRQPLSTFTSERIGILRPLHQSRFASHQTCPGTALYCSSRRSSLRATTVSLALGIVILDAAPTKASELVGPARFCGYAPIIDLLPGEKVTML